MFVLNAVYFHTIAATPAALSAAVELACCMPVHAINRVQQNDTVRAKVIMNYLQFRLDQWIRLFQHGAFRRGVPLTSRSRALLALVHATPAL